MNLKILIMRLTRLCCLLFLVLIIAPAAFAQEATEIIERADQKMRGEFSVAEVSMSIIRPY